MIETPARQHGSPPERTLGQLVADATHDLSTLVRTEVALAKAEVTADVKKAGAGAGMFAGAAVVALPRAHPASDRRGLRPGRRRAGAWLAFLIVAVVLLLVAAVLALVGKQAVKQGPARRSGRSAPRRRRSPRSRPATLTPPAPTRRGASLDDSDASSVRVDGPWEHRFVSANGARFHVAEAGDGPLVLLLHGFPQFWWAWRHQMPALADAGYRVAAMDLRGYGACDKPPRGYDPLTLAADVAGVIRSLGERTPSSSATAGAAGSPGRCRAAARVTRAVAACRCRTRGHAPGARPPGAAAASGTSPGCSGRSCPSGDALARSATSRRLLRAWARPGALRTGGRRSLRRRDAVPFVAHSARWSTTAGRCARRLAPTAARFVEASRAAIVRPRAASCRALATPPCWRDRPPVGTWATARYHLPPQLTAPGTSCPRSGRTRSRPSCSTGLASLPLTARSGPDGAPGPSRRRSRRSAGAVVSRRLRTGPPRPGQRVARLGRPGSWRTRRRRRGRPGRAAGRRSCPAERREYREYTSRTDAPAVDVLAPRRDDVAHARRVQPVRAVEREAGDDRGVAP